MKISVLGLGYVGCISLGCLAECGHQVVGVDVSEIKTELIRSGKATIVEAKIGAIIKKQRDAGNIDAHTDHIAAIKGTELSIICVGTPARANGNPNLDQVMRVAIQIGEAIKTKNTFHTIVIRSTVPPGTHQQVRQAVQDVSGKDDKKFAVVSNPEFLREGSAVDDYYNPPITVMATDNDRAIAIMKELYKEITTEVTVVNINVAEMIKYVNNGFHALKVGFANEVGNICKNLGIDSRELMDIFKRDRQLNISTAYLDPGFAYGGACLPKDLQALCNMADDHLIETPIIKAINPSNEIHKDVALQLILEQGKQEIGILGISFKAGTDDLRNSPIVEVIEKLLGKGYNVLVHDKNINISGLLGANKAYIQNHLPHISGIICRDLNQVISKSQVLVINHNQPEYRGLEKIYPDKQIIYLVPIEDHHSNGNCHGICW